MSGAGDDRVVAEIERWFGDNGLPYFVREDADALRSWLTSRRVLAVLLLGLVVAVGAGLAVGELTPAGGPWGVATGAVVLLVLLSVYARLLRLATMLRWAVRRTFASLGLMFPLLTRALPLLLLAVTFLFVNAEVWQVAGLVSRPRLYATVGLFAAIAVVFLLVRLPEEVRRVELEASDERLSRSCAGTPAQAAVDDGTRPHRTELSGPARVNLVLVLLFNQALQVLLLTLVLFVFFVVLGLIAITPETVEAWTGSPVSDLPSIGDRVPVSNELWQVSVFLAAFAGLYFTVYAVTDETYRRQFFSSVAQELERALGVHAVYVRRRAGDEGPSGEQDSAQD